MLHLNPLIACLLLIIVFFLLYSLINPTHAQVQVQKRIPLAYRANQAARYSEVHKVLQEVGPIPIRISDTVLKSDQPLTIYNNLSAYRLNIYDRHGHPHLITTISEPEYQLNLSHMDTGSYQLIFQSGDKTYTYHVLLKK